MVGPQWWGRAYQWWGRAYRQWGRAYGSAMGPCLRFGNGAVLTVYVFIR
jgi:hypothetical protein